MPSHPPRISPSTYHSADDVHIRIGPGKTHSIPRIKSPTFYDEEKVSEIQLGRIGMDHVRQRQHRFNTVHGSPYSVGRQGRLSVGRLSPMSHASSSGHSAHRAMAVGADTMSKRHSSELSVTGMTALHSLQQYTPSQSEIAELNHIPNSLHFMNHYAPSSRNKTFSSRVLSVSPLQDVPHMLSATSSSMVSADVNAMDKLPLSGAASPSMLSSEGSEGLYDDGPGDHDGVDILIGGRDTTGR